MNLHFAVDSQDCNLPIFAKLRRRVSLLFNLFIDLGSSIEQPRVIQNTFRAVRNEQRFPC